MGLATFDFEKPILEVERQIEDLTSQKSNPKISRKITELEKSLHELKVQIYGNLTPWQRVQLARHMARPHSLDFIKAIFTNWTEVHGDRNFSDDKAVVTGFGHFGERPVTIIGQQKGKDTKENLARNFGMMHPEGYRKAMRLMRTGEKFNLPIIIFIDTPGAYPGIGAEERGQAEAIARNIRDMFTIEVPIIVIIIGEGASGGALGIGVGDVVLMLENAWYCVISPEGCASILWRDRAMAARSAEALKLTATDLLDLKVIDETIPEPLGGAHRDPAATYENVRAYIAKYLERLTPLPVPDLLNQRALKYREMGVFVEDTKE
ncbi:MAG TPA: acetyl-CoA carboxylase carboxyltransferase subunit alpha [Candidatus Sumerlaeota bacterium]|nr:acetyl-CoA carboxylase carboxyltransferase subunit alpha [Candidatus Sumerlaeota bacterium]HPL74207.1 acetyl-CoA carboxylase carboxyltransferase subunit alpha [Candidatus Sumerlaeota bacterium]